MKALSKKLLVVSPNRELWDESRSMLLLGGGVICIKIMKIIKT